MVLWVYAYNGISPIPCPFRHGPHGTPFWTIIRSRGSPILDPSRKACRHGSHHPQPLIFRITAYPISRTPHMPPQCSGWGWYVLLMVSLIPLISLWRGVYGMMPLAYIPERGCQHPNPGSADPGYPESWIRRSGNPGSGIPESRN